jgi:hypothetical protein
MGGEWGPMLRFCENKKERIGENWQLNIKEVFFRK